ncbi:MAG TPA: hypothetical protein VMP01_17215 [Pirellulaceae bacterium]|nr:hypothetical protein [Pirellulaceae bacterium]
MSKAELADFIQFAKQKLDSDQQPASLEELLGQWRDQCTLMATMEDVRQGLNDYAAGQGEPVEDAFRDIRHQLGLRD